MTLDLELLSRIVVQHGRLNHRGMIPVVFWQQ